MTPSDFLPLAVLALLVGLSVVQRKASTAVQPLRLVLAEKGEQFLARTDVPAGLRADVERQLASPFSCNCYLLFLALPLLPFLVWMDLGSSKHDERFSEMRSAGHEVRGRYLEIRAIHRKIALANHPIISPVGDLLISLAIVVAVPVLLLARRLNEGTLDRDSAAAGVDEYWSQLPKIRHNT